MPVLKASPLFTGTVDRGQLQISGRDPRRSQLIGAILWREDKHAVHFCFTVEQHRIDRNDFVARNLSHSVPVAI